MIDIRRVTRELNARAQEYQVGDLQGLRKRIHGAKKKAGSNLFQEATTNDTYAFHYGGRTELQFNVGSEFVSGEELLRYGVAFSLELSQTLPDLSQLEPKIARFNEFIRDYPEAFGDLWMWHYSDGKRSADYRPAPIPEELVRPKRFIFLGDRQSASLDWDTILSTFDRLLQLYEFVEGFQQHHSPPIQTQGSFVFRPGCTVKPISTQASSTARMLDVSLRHNALQLALYRKLVSTHGEGKVGTEIVAGLSSRIDLVVKNADSYDIYEIKTQSTARACIREALGQLFDYAFWTPGMNPSQLTVVGEPALDPETKLYLQKLNSALPVPVSYMQISVP